MHPKLNDKYNPLASLIPRIITCTEIKHLNKTADKPAATVTELAAALSPTLKEAIEFEKEGSANLHAAFSKDTSDNNSKNSQGDKKDGKPKASSQPSPLPSRYQPPSTTPMDSSITRAQSDQRNISFGDATTHAIQSRNLGGVSQGRNQNRSAVRNRHAQPYARSSGNRHPQITPLNNAPPNSLQNSTNTQTTQVTFKFYVRKIYPQSNTTIKWSLKLSLS